MRMNCLAHLPLVLRLTARVIGYFISRSVNFISNIDIINEMELRLGENDLDRTCI